VPAGAVAYVSPAFKKYTPLTIFFNRVEPAFKSDTKVKRRTVLHCDRRKRFGTLAGAAHEFFAARRRMRNSTVHFEADDFKTAAGGEETGNLVKRFADSGKFWFAGATDCDGEARHLYFAGGIVPGAGSKEQFDSGRPEENPADPGPQKGASESAAPSER